MLPGKKVAPKVAASMLKMMHRSLFSLWLLTNLE
jgi:hypothetical protein